MNYIAINSRTSVDGEQVLVFSPETGFLMLAVDIDHGKSLEANHRNAVFAYLDAVGGGYVAHHIVGTAALPIGLSNRPVGWITLVQPGE